MTVDDLRQRHSNQDDRQAHQHVLVAGPGDHQGEQQPGGQALPGRDNRRSRQIISPAVISAATSMP